MIGVTAQVRRYVRRRGLMAVGQALLRRSLVIGVGLATLLVLAGLAAVPLPVAAPAAVAAVFAASLAAMSLLLRPARLHPVIEDEALQASDALATVALAGADGPALELVARDAWLRLCSRRAREQAWYRHWRLLLELGVLALLVWLAFTVLPGHRPVDGPGVASGQGAGAEGPTSGGARRQPDPAQQSEPKPDQPKPKPEAPKPEEQEPEEPKPEEPKPEEPQTRREPPPPAARVADLVVFPDFTGAERTTEREAPSIERAPQATGAAGARRPPASAAAREPQPPEPRVEWQRQRERAMARQRLAPWEGAWIDRYGDALEAQPLPPAKESKR